MPRGADQPDPGLFARALDEAIRNRGLALSSLSGRLRDRGTPASVAALSSWRAGKRRPERTRSLDALDTLEELLDLPRGHLASRLGPTRRVRPDRTQLFEDLVVEGDALSAMKSAMGFTDEADLDLICGSQVVEVDKDPCRWSVTSQIHWRARVADGQRALAMLQLDNPVDQSPHFTVLGGAHVRPHRWDQRSGFALWELVLEHPLRVGQTARTEYRVDVVESEPLASYWAAAEGRTPFLALEVRWGGDVPRHLELRRDLDEVLTVQVVPVVGRTAHRVETNFGPGAYGFEWS